MDADAIPRDLRDLPQWVLYRVQTRKGKATKIPYQPGHTGRRASSTDPATWGTFELALEAHVTRGRGDGIGFVFTPDDPFVGIDLDACLRAGVLDERARPIVERLRSYTEVSPSGGGLHVMGRGEVGGGRRTSHTPWGGELEVYDRDRYFTVTGDRFAGTPAEVLELVELGALRAELLPELVTPNGNGHARLVLPERLDDRDLLEKAFAASNGAKFLALFQGDTSGYPSQSEAEMALCRMIAFWAGPDAQRIDWLFRQSALVRSKWDRVGADTIAKVLATQTEFYGQTAPAPLRAVTTPEDALGVASAAIRMADMPLVAADEQGGGRIVLERVDGLYMTASSLGTFSTFAKLAGELAAQFGHELVVPKDEKTATAHRFVAALRRHLGPAQVRAAEQRVEGWFVDLARFAGEAFFEAGDAEGRLRVWRSLDEFDPELETGAQAFAKKVVLGHELTTGDRYLRAGWAQEYMRRCGWHGSLEQAAGMLEAIGLVQPNPRSGGQVRAHWRAGGQTITLRFWVIPAERFEQWRAES